MKPLYAVSIIILGLPTLLAAQRSLSRPLITGIANVAVYETNLAQSKRFYVGLLGLPESDARTYRVNPLQSVRVDPLQKGAADRLESITFATADVNALRRYLIGRHVVVSEKLRTRADGARSFWVNDPEGHRIVFIQGEAERHPVVAATSSPESQVSRHILHAGFIVHDRGAEDHFYRDVLGFREAWHGGMKDGTIDWIDMQVPDGDDWIEYMLRGPTPPSAEESGVLNHFALGVPSIQRAADFLKRRGRGPSDQEKAQIGRDGKWQLNLYDPDGTRVELMEFMPVRTPCCSPYSLSKPK